MTKNKTIFLLLQQSKGDFHPKNYKMILSDAQNYTGSNIKALYFTKAALLIFRA